MCLVQKEKKNTHTHNILQHRKKSFYIGQLFHCIPWELKPHGWRVSRETGVGVIKEKYFLNTSKESIFKNPTGWVLSKIQLEHVQNKSPTTEE